MNGPAPAARGSPRRALIFDTLHTGHHLNWVRWIAEALLARGTAVQFACGPDAPGRVEFRHALGHLDDRLDTVPVPLAAGRRGLAARWRKRRALANLVAATDADAVFVPFLDEIASRSLASLGPPGRLAWFPDPIEAPPPSDPSATRARYGLPPNARVVGFFGRATRAKGADRLARAFQARPSVPDEYLLFVGPVDPELRAPGAGLGPDNPRADRMVVEDRFVAPSDLLAAIDAVDVVAVPYLEQFGASFLLRAAAAGKPVLGTALGHTGWVMERFRLGHAVDVRDGAALAAGLEWAFRGRPADEAPDAGALAARHRPERALAALLAPWEAAGP